MVTKEKNNLLVQFKNQMLTVYDADRIKGLMKRILNRLRDKPQLELAYHILANLNEIQAPQAKIDVEIKEVSVTDDKYLDELATIPSPSYSKAQIVKFLSEDRRCYVVLYDDHVVCSYWVLRKGFKYYRDLVLADNEEYQLSGYTLPEFRGKGLMPYLVAVTSQWRSRITPNLHAIGNVAINNKSQLRSVKKQGFSRVGFVGFVRMFGFRFHFLIGRKVFPATKKRFYVEEV